MNAFSRLSGLILAVLLLTACSTTEMISSWSSSDYQGSIKNVYIIGISKDETNRRIFEDTFSRQLASQGIGAVSSYKDLPGGQETDKGMIMQRMTRNGCDSVLLTRLINQRKETVVNPGYVSGYSSRPYYGGRSYYGRPAHYNDWGSFYDRRYDVVYQPSTVTEFTVLTVESALYDLKSEELIWSGQLETYVEKSIDEMIQDFVETVSKDLKEKGLI